MQPGDVWTPERVEQLRVLVAARTKSYGEIAIELGAGITRNAVLSKALRMKLPGTENRSTQAPKPPRQPKPAPDRARLKQQKPLVHKIAEARKASEEKGIPVREAFDEIVEAIAPKPVTTIVDVIPAEQRLSLVQLTERTCKWPLGDPQHADFHFCGARKPAEGGPYCEFHARRAYQRS